MIEKVNGEPTVPLAVAALVIVGALRLIVRTSVSVSVPAVFVAEMVTLTGPPTATTGVPEITPVVVLILRPVGSPVALKLAGRLFAVMVYVNAAPDVPLAVSALVMTGVTKPILMLSA